jgi:autotransporter passenger strand-loop-strand repeat protein
MGGFPSNFTSVVSSGHTVTSVHISGTEVLGVYGTTVDSVISDGGAEVVISTGLAIDSQIEAGGFEYLSAGGESIGAVVDSGGEELAYRGGFISGGTVSSGGTLVLAGGTASGVSFQSGANEVIMNGTGFVSGYASGLIITVSSGGVLSVTGVTDGVTVSAGGRLIVGGGAAGTDGVAAGGTVDGGGRLTVSGLGMAQDMAIHGDAFILRGGVALSLDVYGTLIVSGGTTTFDQIMAGGQEIVSSGGISNDAAISAGGELFVSASGTAVSATIADGGFLLLQAGSAVGCVVGAGGVLDNDGAVFSTLVQGGGTVVDSDAISEFSRIASGGVEIVSSGSTATSAIISGGGTLVFAGGAVSGASLQAGALEIIQGNGGTGAAVAVSGLAVASGVTLAIEALGSAVDATIGTGGIGYVYSGGTSLNGTIGAGGILTVEANGSALGGVVQSGGTEIVSSGGIASGVTVAAGGTLTFAGGTVSGVSFQSGSNEVVSNASVTVSTSAVQSITVSQGGVVTVASGGTTDNATVVSGGTLVLAGGVANGVQFDTGSTEAVVTDTYAAMSFTVGEPPTETRNVHPHMTLLISSLPGLPGRAATAGAVGMVTVYNGGLEVLSAGGIADLSIVSAGGVLLLDSGGYGSQVEVDSGGTLIYAGGSAGSAVFEAGAIEAFAGGGTLTAISTGATLDLTSGRYFDRNVPLSAALVQVAATAVLAGKGTITGPVLNNGRIEASGGALSIDGLSGVGTLAAFDNGTLVLTGRDRVGLNGHGAITGAGTLMVGTATPGVVAHGAQPGGEPQAVLSDDGAAISIARVEVLQHSVLSGFGTITGSVLDNGTIHAEDAGTGALVLNGSIHGTGVLSAAAGATLTLQESGTTTLTETAEGLGTLLLEGTVVLASDHTVYVTHLEVGSGATVQGHHATVYGTITNAGTIEAGGLNIRGSVLNGGGVFEATSGTSDIQGLVTGGSLSIGNEDAAILSLLGGTTAGTEIAFANAAGRADDLRLGDILAFSATINDFGTGDTIDLIGLTATGFTYSGGFLNIMSDDTVVAALRVAGNYATSSFSVSDHGRDTFITVKPA